MAGDQIESVWTPANKVTFARIIFIPVFVAMLLAPWPDYFPESYNLSLIKPWLAALIFIILSFTDTVDGYLARTRGEITDFGKFMDPLADKLLVCAALLGLIELGVLPSWVALIIISREFIVSGVRMLAASKGEVIAASWYGKIKTVLQMVAIVLFIIKDSHAITSFSALFHDGLYLVSWAVMLAAVAMTLISMFDYLYKSRALFGFTTLNKEEGAQPYRSGVVVDDTLEPNSVLDSLVSESEKSSEIQALATRVLDMARMRGATLATAESCTGGLISGSLTAIPGSSDVFLGAIVSYANSVKMHELGVCEETLQNVGAVSEETACQMALGVREKLGANIAVAVTGIAGPGGEEAGKPVGTVWIAYSSPSETKAKRFLFSGNRSQVRTQTTVEALKTFRAQLG